MFCDNSTMYDKRIFFTYELGHLFVSNEFVSFNYDEIEITYFHWARTFLIDIFVKQDIEIPSISFGPSYHILVEIN